MPGRKLGHLPWAGGFLWEAALHSGAAQEPPHCASRPSDPPLGSLSQATDHTPSRQPESVKVPQRPDWLTEPSSAGGWGLSCPGVPRSPAPGGPLGRLRGLGRERGGCGRCTEPAFVGQAAPSGRTPPGRGWLPSARPPLLEGLPGPLCPSADSGHFLSPVPLLAGLHSKGPASRPPRPSLGSA